MLSILNRSSKLSSVHHDQQSVSVQFRQVIQLTKASLKTRYRNTWSGYLWVLLNPIFIYSAQSFAFHFILKINLVNYSLFLALGLLPWIFIVSSIEMSTSILLTNSRLLKSFPLQPLTLIFSQILDNFINYASAFIVLLVPIAIWTNWSLYKIVFLILPLLSLFVFVSACCFLFAQIHVFFRDTKFILNFVLQVAFYITPIFYPEQLIPENMRWLLRINIFYYIIKPFQILTSEWTLTNYLNSVCYSWLISLAILGLSILFWKKKRNELYFYF